jgi:hypothetical protein
MRSIFAVLMIFSLLFEISDPTCPFVRTILGKPNQFSAMMSVTYRPTLTFKKKSKTISVAHKKQASPDKENLPRIVVKAQYCQISQKFSFSKLDFETLPISFLVFKFSNWQRPSVFRPPITA